MSGEEPSVSAIAEVVAEVLRTRPEELRPDVPLVRYGLDSMAMVEVVGELETRFGCGLEVEHLPEALSLQDLHAALLAGRKKGAETREASDPFAALFADAQLPEDWRATPMHAAGRPRRVLLTGATGFLGAFLVARLLREDDLQLVCLVRCADAEAGRDRIGAALDRYGLAVEPEALARVAVLPGNLALPGLGLTAAARAQAANVDAVLHLGAAVNWVAPYSALRATNVLATRELLELAASGGASFHFLSSLAVAYASPGPATFDEKSDPLPHLRGFHFGYAQSKVVAESLVRQAGDRGLPVAVYRAALITGESRSGRSNPEDFLALFLGGCVRLGAAPEIDWSLDAVPVDFVIDVLTRGLLNGAPPVLHLLNPRQRALPEAWLFLHLYGYALELLPYADWLRKLLDRLDADPEEPLQQLRGFFTLKAAGAYLPELYEDGRRTWAEDAASRRWLETLNLECPPLGTALLEKLSDHLVETGNWPRPQKESPARVLPPIAPDLAFWQRFFADVVAAEATDQGSRHSILTELTSWSSRRRYGLFRYRLHREGRPPQNVVLKVKSQDEETIAVAKKVAHLADKELGKVYARWADRLFFRSAHHRELALLGQADERFRRHSPEIFGIVSDDKNGHWLAVTEFLENVELLDSADDLVGWRNEHTEAAIRGLAKLQAIHFGRGEELKREPWIGVVMNTRSMAEIRELWLALEKFSRHRFATWAGAEISQRHQDLIATLEEWWPTLEAQPQTLIHNDFNPRNLCFRKTAQGPKLVVYDWELATCGAPQHDLAELLCFVLGPQTTSAEIVAWIELHRQALEAETTQKLDPVTFLQGFKASLADLLVNRLPMYTLVDRFRRQKFLPRVLATWRRLDELDVTTSQSASAGVVSCDKPLDR